MHNNIQVNDSVFNRKIDHFLNHLYKPLAKNLPLYTEWFIQSAIKTTGPKRGYKKRRTVIELKTNRFTRRGNEKKRYKVPFRNNKKQGAQYFNKKKDASKFSKIIYRFIGKYGWLAGGENVLKKKLNVKMPKISQEVQALKHQIGKGKRKYMSSKPFVLIINAVEKIAKYALYTSQIALKKTERRIKNASNKRKLKNQYKRIWK